ncbi:MAG: hypothetical protein WBR26_15125 [Candidatus Acidiferrum sp.]
MATQPTTAGLTSFPQGRLWFGTCAGAAAWAMQGFLCVAISAALCHANYSGLEGTRETGTFILLVVITAALLGLTLIAAAVSFSNWQRLTNNRPLMSAEATGREQYMALIGVFANVVFTLGILWGLLAVLLVHMCVRAR